MSGVRPKIEAILSHVPLFDEMSAEEVARLARQTREVRVARGHMVFQRGDPSNGFYWVVYGQIKLAIASADGAEKVIEIIDAGQSFGEAVMFMEKPYPVFAQTLSDALLLHVSRAAVFEEIACDPEFARKMLAGLSRRLHGLVGDVEAYSLRSCTQRVIGYLLQSDREEAPANGEIVVALPVGKAVIASRLNITPETLSRVFHQLSGARLITVNGRDVCIHDIDRLRAYEG